MQDPVERAKMTRKERAEIVDRVLDRYDRLGALIVGDNESLCRLLNPWRSTSRTVRSATT